MGDEGARYSSWRYGFCKCEDVVYLAWSGEECRFLPVYALHARGVFLICIRSVYHRVGLGEVRGKLNRTTSHPI